MKELKGKFLKELSMFLSEEGFNLLSGSDSYIKVNDDIRKKIFVDIITRLDGIAVLFDFRIKSLQIEDIKNKTREKPRKDSDTILVTDHYLLLLNGIKVDTSPWRVIKSSDELDSAVEKFKVFMREIGFPFFEKFNAISDLDKWLNEQIINGTYNFQTGANSRDSIGGLIAAKLNNNPKYEEIYNIWMQKMAEKGNETKTIKELESTKHFLDILPPIKT